MKDIVLFGAGGFGREAANMINDSINKVHPNTYRLIGYIVDEQYAKPGTDINGYPVLGDISWLINHRDDVVCGLTIGEHFDEKERVFRLLDENHITIETLIDGWAYVPSTCKIGRGCYIGYNSLLSANCEIGDGVFLNTQCNCGHDVKIGNFSTLYTRVSVSGYCTIGSHVMIGGCAYIVPHRKIGDGAVVAAGSVVFTNVKSNTHVMGNPAKRIEL